ncbi:MAG: HAMP domain-containing protein [Actinobacteria bacterium]|nr:HAMP domain-containing protein [Actinomycetota bacterium]
MVKIKQGGGTTENGGSIGRRKRSITLYQTTLLVLVVFLLAGFASYFIYYRSQERLIDTSRDKLLQMEVDTVSSLCSYGVDFLIYLGEEKIKGLNTQSLEQSIAQGTISPPQEFLNDTLTEMVDSGFLGIEAGVLILFPSAQNPQAVIVASNDEELIHKHEVSPELLEAFDDNKPYIWAEEGIPELKIDGMTLVVTELAEVPGTDLKLGVSVAKPMEDDVAAIDRFFNEKKSKGSRNLMLLTIISIVMTALLTLVFLAVLVRRRITRPMDELSSFAQEIMEGDLDVEIPVKKGEEFAGLKKAINTMVDNLKAVIALPVSEGDDTGLGSLATGAGLKEGSGDQRTRKYSGKSFVSGRSRTLYYITIFLVMIFLLSGTVNFFVFNHWQNELIDDSVNKMVERSSEYFSGVSLFVRNSLDPLVTEKLEVEQYADISISEMFAMMIRGESNPYQQFYNEFSKDIVDKGLMGLEDIIVVMAGPLVPGGAIVVVASDEDLVGNWPVPDYLVKAMEDDVHYLYFEDGIKELGLTGEQIMAIKTFETLGMTHSYIGVKSMHTEIMELREFYDNEKGSVYLQLIPVMAGTLIVLVLLTFLILDFLIRKNITNPINELSHIAELVMEGQLDVDIPVREGEELEGLKRAFGEMVNSFRILIERSTGM